MSTSPFDYLLGYIVRRILPQDLIIKIDRPEKFKVVINFVKTSISLSPVYVKAPEIVLRIALFCIIFVFCLIEICSFKHFTLCNSVRLLKKIHPLLDDGIRLYSFLAMYAIFEEDSFRKDHGFLPYSEIVKPFKNLRSSEKSKN